MKNSLLLQNFIQNYNWLKERGFAHSDVLIEKFADPVTRIHGHDLVCFCSNNYLGLSKRPEVIEAAQKALLEHGIGTCESRRLGGNLNLLEELEAEIADFKHSEDAIIFATGLMVNVGVIPALTDSDFYIKLFYGREIGKKEFVILGDEINHRSIQMGIKLSKADFFKYRHSDMDHLEELLEKNKGKIMFIITDSVFSMDGDLAHLDRITELAEKYEAAVMIDEAHGTGVWGQNGRGAAEHFGVCDKIEVAMGTLSKALGGLGGFVSGRKEMVDMLKINTSTYYFTSSLPADEAAGLIASFKILKKEPELRAKLWKNIDRMVTGLLKIGVNTPKRYSQIIPIIIGDEEKAFKIEQDLYEYGILCSAVGAPAVAHGMERIRCTINSTHTFEHIDKFLEATAALVKKYDLPVTPLTETEISAFKNSAPDYIKAMVKK